MIKIRLIGKELITIIKEVDHNAADFSSTYKILEENNIAFISITEQFEIIVRKIRRIKNEIFKFI